MTMMTETLVSGTTPVSDNVNLKQHLNTPSEEGQTLRGSVEKALHNYKELRSFRQRVASGHRSPEGVGKAGWFGLMDVSIFSVESGEKEVLTAASNAVEFASR